MLELTLETLERYRSIEIGSDTVAIWGRDGRRHGPTEPLDVEAALAPLGPADPWVGLPEGVVVGHVHLHVPDLSAAVRFYRDVIGFREHAVMEPFGMADLSAGGAFPHRIAVNNWHGPAARPAPPGSAGMRRFELLLADAEARESVRTRAASVGAPIADGDALVVQDPSGSVVAVMSA